MLCLALVGKNVPYIDVGATPNVCLDILFDAATYGDLGRVNSKPFL